MFLNLLQRTYNKFSLLGLEQQQYSLVLFWLSLVVSLPLPSRVIFITVAIVGILVNFLFVDKLLLL